jgi:hypothetical protein
MNCKICGELAVSGIISADEPPINIQYSDSPTKSFFFGLIKYKTSTKINNGATVYKCLRCKLVWLPYR